ncbi:MAG TPA: tol-pal system protein YbgF, partial [Nitrospiria bacterium]|nr:tol-pal system protein YbgF [Nitrospiria bacterium]
RLWTLSLALFAVSQSALMGCATQADMMDIQFELDRQKKERADTRKRLLTIENYLKKGALPTQSGQAGDMFFKLDQVSEDLRVVQGRLEENSHFLADLVQRLDDESFRAKELTGRLDALDMQIASLEKSLAAKGPGPSGIPPGGGAVPPAGGSAPQGVNPQGDRVVLPGRPTQPDQTSGLSPSEAYGLAYNDYLKGNYDLALLGFQNFLSKFEATSLAPNAQYWIGESYYGKKDYLKAIDAFDRVKAEYPESSKVPGAVLKAGYSFVEIGDKAKARSYLKQVVEQYPLTNEAKLAKDKLAEIQ